MNTINNNKLSKTGIAVLTAILITASAHAEGSGTDVTSQISVMTAGVATIATIAGGVAAVSAGVALFKAVKKFFSKAS